MRGSADVNHSKLTAARKENSSFSLRFLHHVVMKPKSLSTYTRVGYMAFSRSPGAHRMLVYCTYWNYTCVKANIQHLKHR